MNPPSPEITPAERLALNAEVARADATGFREAIPTCPDFEYLCQAAKKAGWMVGISVGDFIEKPRDERGGRRCLGAIKLRRDRKSPVKVEVPIADDLALASRIALDELLAQRGAK